MGVLIVGNTLALTGPGLPMWLTWPLFIATAAVFMFVFLGRVMAPLFIWLFGR